MAIDTLSLPGEVWKPVTGYEGLYCVSSIGRVVSLARFVTEQRKCGLVRRPIPEKIIQPVLSGNYLRVALSKEGRTRRKRVHRLVCAAFNGPPPFPEAIARHLNDIWSDNRPDNLQWGTPAENAQDRARNNRTAIGERAPTAKLTDDQVRIIRSKPREYGMCASLAREYGVSEPTMADVLSGVTWKHVD